MRSVIHAASRCRENGAVTASRHGAGPGSEMSLRKKFFSYTIPAIISMWMFSIYTIVDGMFVAAGVNSLALAGVNIAMPFVNLVLGVSLLFSTGAAAVISIYLGRGELPAARQVYMTILAVLIVVGLAITGLAVAFMDPLVEFLGATPNLYGYTRDYLETVLYFAVFQILAYFFEVMSRADGYPKVATASVAIAGVLNVVLDYFFVMVFEMGVAGAAWATGISQAASVVFLVAHILLSKRQLTFCRFRFSLRAVIDSVPLGVADSITEFSVGIVIFLFNHRILEIIGEEALVSYTVIAYVNTLVLMTMFGLAQGMLPLVSFHHGSNEPGKVRALLSLALKTAVGCSLGWFVLCELFTGTLVGLFIDQGLEPALFADTVADFRIYAVSFLFMGVNVVLSTWFSAVERPAFAIAMALARSLVVIAVTLYALSALFGPLGIWLSAGVSEILCLFGGLLLYRRHAEKTVTF